MHSTQESCVEGHLDIDLKGFAKCQPHCLVLRLAARAKAVTLAKLHTQCTHVTLSCDIPLVERCRSGHRRARGGAHSDRAERRSRPRRAGRPPVPPDAQPLCAVRTARLRIGSSTGHAGSASKVLHIEVAVEMATMICVRAHHWKLRHTAATRPTPPPGPGGCCSAAAVVAAAAQRRRAQTTRLTAHSPPQPAPVLLQHCPAAMGAKRVRELPQAIIAIRECERGGSRTKGSMGHQRNPLQVQELPVTLRMMQ
ncbi:hypothetical protein JKP88DRAFT_252322 [Tribonema minus]|uniref:Uncharacterized protein n=1 Tax=Tribonema minus TaxID=303371 RepID=A0A835ZBZ9_9STRA|nr:hypothetical protein JKP88DRAFT_252322 [Tribonema minus]